MCGSFFWTLVVVVVDINPTLLVWGRRRVIDIVDRGTLLMGLNWESERLPQLGT